MKLSHLKLLFTTALFSIALNASAEVININDASAAAMSHYLKGVGDVKAESIVRYRELNGDFKSLEDLVNVKGIGKRILKKNRENLSLTEGIVKWIKSKPKLVTLDTKESSKKKVNKSVSKTLASKPANKVRVKKVKKKLLTDLESSSLTPKKKDVLNVK